MLQMGSLGGVASEAAGGAARLRRLYCRFAGMVEPGDTLTFSAADAGPGKLALSAINQRGEAVLTKASAEYL
jgi:acyl dehydratase